ncbi:MAG: RNA 3'-terminal phosphate cyclase [Methanomicrobia archaeon]|nr:RNA 3'-terminal phosphate cyclase [Methanomicrobia archaeon]
MLPIDGSVGEGGGQIIRTAIALAAITGKEVELTNIRANRPKPGLSAQHLHAVEAVERISGGHTEGLALRSTHLIFTPGTLKGFKGEIDIGTAGSITLLLQCLIPVALFADRETSVKITGGTDVNWSPPIDFYLNVFLKALREMGCAVYLDLKRRGYYPKGGGVVDVTVTPVTQLKGFVLQEPETANVIKGVSHSSGLPAHVAERQANAAKQTLKGVGYNAKIKMEIEEDGKRTTGSGITLWRGYKSGTALGERGKRAEIVGEEAARNIITELETAATVDVHLADQLVPYIALADDKSELRVREMTKHLETNIFITQQFLDVEFEIEQERTKEGKEVFVVKRG